MKRIISIALGLLMVLSITAGLTGCGAKASEGLEFKSNGDGTCAWTGLGTCTDSKIVVPNKNGEETVISVAPKTITSGDDSITEIVFPSTLETIDEDAFYVAKSLSKVTFNSGLKTISEQAFDCCTGLTEVVFPDSLETIGDSAFDRCSGLKNISFSKSLKTIGKNAFCGCTELTEIVLPEGLTDIGKFAFSDCKAIKKISIPSTVNELYFRGPEETDSASFGYTFLTDSLEEIELKGEWKNFKLTMGMAEVSGEYRNFYSGELCRDASKSEYPDTYSNITDENLQSVICALLNKDTIKVNGEDYTMTSEKPLGVYKISGMNGFTAEEFKENDVLSLSYEPAGIGTEKISDIISGTYSLDEKSHMYHFSEKTIYDGSSLDVEKYFVFFGDFIISCDRIDVDGSNTTNIDMWTPAK